MSNKIENFNLKKDGEENSPMKSFPYFEESVFERLPDCIKGFFNFSGKRENDMFLNTMLPALGTVLFNVSGEYDGRIVYPNLYSINCAPPASGKGVQNFVTNFLNVAEEMILSENKELGKNLLLPGNSSSSAIVQFMTANKLAMINETEIDVLINTLGQEWGDYTSILRQAFQHELISVNRKEFGLQKVKEPKLSVSLAGTPDQLINLFRSAENGLLSRFMIYLFNESAGFRDVRPKTDRVSYNESIDKASKNLMPLINEINKSARRFDFTDKQWDLFHEKFKALKESSAQLYGDSISGCVIRLALIQYRIAMILSLLREAENAKLDQSIICNDVDFEIAGQLVDVYYYNIVSTLKAIPKEVIKINNHAEMVLFDNLPCGDFSLAQVQQIAERKTICSPRSVNNHLKRLVEKGLIQQPVKYGSYVKDCEGTA